MKTELKFHNPDNLSIAGDPPWRFFLGSTVHAPWSPEAELTALRAAPRSEGSEKVFACCEKHPANGSYLFTSCVMCEFLRLQGALCRISRLIQDDPKKNSDYEENDDTDALVELVRASLAPRSETEGCGIYVASKVRYADLWRQWRAEGQPIISTWIDEADEGASLDYAELSTRCLEEVKRCACLVIYATGSTVDDVLKGALLEAGAALAFGKRVICTGYGVNISRVFREHPLWSQHETLEECFATAAALTQDKEGTR